MIFVLNDYVDDTSYIVVVVDAVVDVVVVVDEILVDEDLLVIFLADLVSYYNIASVVDYHLFVVRIAI